MRWYSFETIKGSMAVLMEGNTLYRLILPSLYSDIEVLLKEYNNENFEIIHIREGDISISLVNKIRDYFTGGVINDWGVKPDISNLPPFYRRSLEYVYNIPYGKTMTYGEIAKAIGSPRASRAVGQANRSNPIPLVIPCHRVVGVNNPGGFSGPGGMQMKMDMLQLEKAELGNISSKNILG